MTATYSGDPGLTLRDQIRFLIGDVDPSTALISDEEIDAVLEMEPSVYPACELLCEALAAKYARMTTTTIGSTSVNYGQLFTQFTQLADRFRKLSNKGASGKGYTSIGPVVLIGGGNKFLGSDETPDTYGG